MTGHRQAARRSYRYYQWMSFVILALIYMIAYFHRSAFSTINTDLEQAFGVSSTSFATLSSIYFYIYLIMQIPAGILGDAFGPRKMAVAGAVVGGVGALIFALAKTYALAFAGRIIVGLGMSTVFIPTLVLVSRWFPERQFATMTALTLLSGNVSSTLSQAPLALLLRSVSWRVVFTGLGGLCLVLAAFAFFIVKDTPAECGFESPLKAVPAQAKRGGHGNILGSVGEILKNPRSWPPFLIYFCGYGASAAILNTFGQAFLMDGYGFTRIEAATYTTICAFVNTVGVILCGRISDKIGKRRPLLFVCGTMVTASWSVIIFFGGGLGRLSLLVVMAMLGMVSALVTMCLSIAKEISDPLHVGAATSMTNMFGFAGAAIAPQLTGFRLDALASQLAGSALYIKAFQICYVLILVLFAMLFFTTETNCTNIYRKKG